MDALKTTSKFIKPVKQTKEKFHGARDWNIRQKPQPIQVTLVEIPHIKISKRACLTCQCVRVREAVARDPVGCQPNGLLRKISKSVNACAQL